MQSGKHELRGIAGGKVGNILASAAVLLMTPGLAFAYVGPGAGISMLGALWGLIVGIVMAVGVILFWPIRVMLRKMKANKAVQTDAGNDQAAGDSDKPGGDSQAAS